MIPASSPAPDPTPAAPASPAIIRGPMDKHEMKFVPRQQVTDYRDHLYHDKPQYNHKGIPYRPVNKAKIQRVHTLGLMPVQPVSDREIKDLTREYFERTGKRARYCVYPGFGPKRYRGITVPGMGQMLFDLRPRPGNFAPYVVDDLESDK